MNFRGMLHPIVVELRTAFGDLIVGTPFKITEVQLAKGIYRLERTRTAGRDAGCGLDTTLARASVDGLGALLDSQRAMRCAWSVPFLESGTSSEPWQMPRMAYRVPDGGSATTQFRRWLDDSYAPVDREERQYEALAEFDPRAKSVAGDTSDFPAAVPGPGADGGRTQQCNCGAPPRPD